MAKQQILRTIRSFDDEYDNIVDDDTERPSVNFIRRAELIADYIDAINLNWIPNYDVILSFIFALHRKSIRGNNLSFQQLFDLYSIDMTQIDQKLHNSLDESRIADETFWVLLDRKNKRDLTSELLDPIFTEKGLVDIINKY